MSARCMRGAAAALLVFAIAAPAGPAEAQDGTLEGEATAEVAVEPADGGGRGSTVRVDRPHEGSRPVALEALFGAFWYGPGMVVGARVDLPLVKNGFVPTLNNAVFLTLGFDLYWARYIDADSLVWERGFGFGVPVALHWEFYFTDALSAFAEVGVNAYFPPSFVSGGDDLVDDAGGWVIAGVGGRWKFADWGALTVRLGTPHTSASLTFFL